MEGVNFDHRPVEKGSILTVCEHGKQVGGGAQSDFQHEQGCGLVGNWLGTRKPGSYNCCLSIRGGRRGVGGSHAQEAKLHRLTSLLAT